MQYSTAAPGEERAKLSTADVSPATLVPENRGDGMEQRQGTAQQDYMRVSACRRRGEGRDGGGEGERPIREGGGRGEKAHLAGTARYFVQERGTWRSLALECRGWAGGEHSGMRTGPLAFLDGGYNATGVPYICAQRRSPS